MTKNRWTNYSTTASPGSTMRSSLNWKRHSHGSQNCTGGLTMSGIGADVRDIVRELDPDGGGYQTSEAASLLIHRYITAGICNADGDPKPKVKALMRLGAGVAFKNYKADSHEHAKKTEKAYAYGEDGDQRDFSEMYEDFAF